MEKYLKCDISEGVFSTESAVGFKDFNGRMISGFFPNEYIKGDKLKVEVLESEKNKSLIRSIFPDTAGYGFFGESAFYVNNKLLSDIV